MTNCNKCGMCCFPRTRHNENLTIVNLLKKCKYQNEDMTCSIYKNRKDIKCCLLRKQLKVNFPNCPQNKEGQIMVTIPRGKQNV